MPVVRGKVLRLGDDVNTDVIIPARYMNSWSTLGDHVFEGESPELPSKARTCSFVVAGKNFGCGSSREQAVLAIRQAGIQCVVAASFARIFYRNAINLALPLLEGIVDAEDGDELEADLRSGVVRNLTRGTVSNLSPLPERAWRIVEDGGLLEHLKRRWGEGET